MSGRASAFLAVDFGGAFFLYLHLRGISYVAYAYFGSLGHWGS